MTADVLELRAFETRDRAALIGWFRTEAELRDFAGPGPRWPLDDQQLDERLAEPGVSGWTAVLSPQTEPIGHIERIRTDEIDRLDRVALSPRHRGQRLAASLVRAALVELPMTGPVDLLVFAGNIPAIRAYRSVGFRDAGPIAPDHADVRRMVLEPDIVTG